MGYISVGSHWLFTGIPQYATSTMHWGRPDGYRYRCSEVFGEGGIDPVKFLADHMDVPDFTESALRRSEFIKLLPEETRAEIIAQAYLRNGGDDEGLVRACLEADIPREAIAKILRARLMVVEVHEMRSNEVDEFIEYGLNERYDRRDGHVIFPEDQPWAVFNDDELKALFLELAKKSPTMVVRYQSTIHLRLGKEAMEEVCREAVKHLKSLRCLNLKHLAWLSLQEKGRILAQVEPDGNNSSLLAYLGVEMVFNEAINYLSADMCLERLSGSSLFLAAVRMSQGKYQDAWKRTRGYFYDRLHKEGYVAGEVEEEVHQHKTKGQRFQKIVNTGDMKYVFDDFGHRWWPSIGDRVIVDVKRARPLTPSVAVTHFLPVDKEVR